MFVCLCLMGLVLISRWSVLPKQYNEWLCALWSQIKNLLPMHDMFCATLSYEDDRNVLFLTNRCEINKEQTWNVSLP